MNKKNKIITLMSFIISILSICLTLTAIIINHLPKENITPTPVIPTPTPIEKKDIDVSNVKFENKEYTYDGEAKELEVSNVPDTLNYEIKYYLEDDLVEEVINTGNYKAVLEFSVKDDKLYNKPDSLEASLIINKRVIDIDELIITNEFIYDKEEKKIAISNLPDGISFNDSYYDKYNNLVNPKGSGVYRAKISFEIENNNYDIEPELELVLNIYSNLKYKEEDDYISVLGFSNGFEEKYINIAKTYNDKPITTISNNAFYESDVFEAILGNNIESIGNQVFSNSLNLMSLTLGENIKTISNTSFNKCYRLKEVINLSDVVLSNNSNIKKYAKDIYDSLFFESKIIYGNNSFIYYLENEELSLINYIGNDKLLTISSKYNEKSISKIDDYALYDLNLNSIVLNSGLKELGKYSLARNNITTIVMPNTLIKINDYALSNLNLLSSVTLQTNINYLGAGVFADSPNLNNIVNFNNIKITKIEDYLFKGCNKIEQITLSNTVKEIGIHSFEGTTNLKNLDISNIEIINEAAFASSGLESIVIPNAISSIPNNAFENANLKNINIPSSIKKIGNNAFSNNINLENIILNNGLEEIGDNAFSGLVKLESITLPNTVTILGERAFIGCMNLKEINLSSNLTKISSFAFESINIENINIPDSVTTIETGAFYECKSLKEIIIPSNVIEMGSNIFDGCINLENVIINAKINRIGTKVFNNCEKLEYVILAKEIGKFVENSINNTDTLIYSYGKNIIIENNNSISNDNIYYYKESLDSVTEAGNYWTIDNGEIKTKINN